MRQRLMRPAAALTALAAGLVLALAACDDTSTTGPAGNATLSILLTDMPGDIAEAWVEITGIYLQGHVDETEGSEGSEEENGHSGRVWLLEGSTGWINLLELAGQTMSLVEDAMVPAGTYHQLRFIVGEALLVTESGAVYASAGADFESLNAARDGLEPIEGADGLLHCPSCSQSGLKVKLPKDMLEMGEASQILVVDFDVSQSFGHQAGKSGRWIMHPVMIASDLSFAGSIGGTVALGDGVELPSCDDRAVTLADFVPTAMLVGDGAEKTAEVDPESGAYVFSFLTPGEYELGFIDTLELTVNDVAWTLTFEADHPAGVTVAAGSSATADYTITGASCETS